MRYTYEFFREHLAHFSFSNTLIIMRKLIITFICLISLCGSLWAQKGEKSLGVNVGYGSLEAFRIGATFTYNVTDQIRLAPSFDYYSDDIDVWGFSFDGHYLFSLANKLDFYPLLGLTYLNTGDNCFGGNIGMGLEYDLSSKFVVGIECKYQVISSDDDILAAKIGLAYKF